MSLAVAACKPAEERAEERYQSGLALLEAGDPDRAIIEFRNVFELDPTHTDARRTLARVQLEQGNTSGAYRQFLRIAENDPDDVESRIMLAEIAFEQRDWAELDRHGEAVAELAGDDPRVRAIDLGRTYRVAVEKDDVTTREGVANDAETLSETLPDNLILRNILIDNYTRSRDFDAALEQLDRLIAGDPDNRDYHNQRLTILAQSGDEAALEASLRDMVERFDEDSSVKATLVRYYLSRDRLDEAEAFMREISDPAAEDPAPYVALVRFLASERGLDAAREAIDRAVEESPNPDLFRALRAGFDFDAGERETAIADLEAVLETAEPSAQTNGIKIALAQMLLTTGNEVGARRLVEETLAADAANVDALLMQSAWSVDADQTDEAIASLRQALDQDPDNVDAMELMASAYQRAGEHDLARDFLSLAVEASGNAPTQSIRYARLLMEEERYLPAEDVLIPALRLNRGNVDLLSALGELYLAMDDMPRTTQLIETLRRLETAPADQAANAIEVEQLRRTGGSEEALSFLESLAEGEDADLTSKLLLLRGRLATGDAEGALSLAETLVADSPDDQRLKFARAATLSATGDLDSAEAAYRALLEDNPEEPRLWLELSRVQLRKGETEDADATIEEALARLPGDPNLLWARASVLERDGQIDDAIAIYETLYEEFSQAPVVANNLASLLSAWRDDEESLERAYTIARRFRDAENPALQDTYGWILHRRGETAEALPYLESAAAGLPDDPITQYHLGMAYSALDRRDDAVGQLRRAVDIAGPADTRSQIEIALAELDRLGGDAPEPRSDPTNEAPESTEGESGTTAEPSDAPADQ